MSTMTEDPPTAVASYDDAFDALFSTAYRVAYRILGARGDADDVAGDVLAKAWLTWDRIELYAPAWVARASANAAISCVRRRDVRDRLRLARPREDDVMVELREDLVRALRRLPSRQREVLVLRYLADLPEQAVADALGCSLGTVKQHAHRALQALRTDGRLAEEETI
jgi:RNA polymerase sigma factor (sigma-70 family)